METIRRILLEQNQFPCNSNFPSLHLVHIDATGQIIRIIFNSVVSREFQFIYKHSNFPTSEIINFKGYVRGFVKGIGN